MLKQAAVIDIGLQFLFSFFVSFMQEWWKYAQ